MSGKQSSQPQPAESSMDQPQGVSAAGGEDGGACSRPPADAGRGNPDHPPGASARSSAKGGRTTISPPSNVKLRPGEPARVLAYGLDTLELSLEIRWQNTAFFDLLDENKELAKGGCKGVLIELYDRDGKFSALNLKPHGSDGYEWLLVGREFSLKIGNWTERKTRPSAMLKISSETLWHQGPFAAVERICRMLQNVFAEILSVKASRVDPCVDVLLPASAWGKHIEDHIVSRAVHGAEYSAHRKLTGIAIGSGDISARLYDKPLEIIMKSNKIWMYDIWGLPCVPADHFIIRVEFQLRREAIKTLGIDAFKDLQVKADGMWSYCTGKWLKLQDDPKKHHTQQKTLDWWQVIQKGFAGAQGAEPLVRAKAIRVDQKQLMRQILGQLSSLAALKIQGFKMDDERKISLSDALQWVRDGAKELEFTSADLTEKIKEKFAKYRRVQSPKNSAVAYVNNSSALGKSVVSSENQLGE